MTMFHDQAQFMTACDQSVGTPNKAQYELYMRLIEEELDELYEAYQNSDREGMLDAITDIMVVKIGCGLSDFRVDQLQDAWDEVIASNMSKIDPQTGKVTKRNDGKVLKPNTYKPPRLGRLL